MTTPHVLEQLPLWIEGDLSAPEMTRLQAHLAECPDCQLAAEALRTSQTWLRESMISPFDATDATRLRRRVMEQLREEARAQPIQHLRVRPALLAACAASILVAALIWRMEPGHGLQTTAVDVPQPIKVAGGQTEPISESPLVHPAMARRPQARTPPVPKPEAQSPPLGEPARIEFQTADPTIRIIWLAQAKPLPDANPIISEAP